MNFVISNYASSSQTESLYFNATLNMIGCNSYIRHKEDQTSIYDIFDKTRPNYYITHISSIMSDAVSYIKENGGIDLILNISGVNQQLLSSAEKILKEEGLNIAFLFTNDEKKLYSKNNIIHLSHAADVFLSKGSFKYSINIGQMVNSKEQIKDYCVPYHTLSMCTNKINFVDIELPITQLSNIYKNYDEIIFRDLPAIVPQILYDAIYFGNSVWFDIEDEQKRLAISDKLKKVLKTDIDLTNKDSIVAKDIKELIISKHTCFHRVKSLLSQLPAQQYLDKLDTLIKGLRI